MVDVPSEVCRLMRDKGPDGMFQSKVVSELEFYRDFFFPNLSSDWWQADNRDKLLLQALVKNNKEINELIKSYPCIPCDSEGRSLLRKPSDLVHPHRSAAKLFAKSECRFPQTVQYLEKTVLETTRADFLSYPSAQRLSELGMILDDLPWEMVLERAKTVPQLKAEETECLKRSAALLEYLSTYRSPTSEFAFSKCPAGIKQSLSQLAFLPTLGKPEDWPFIWAGGAIEKDFQLSSPSELFSDKLKNLVGCHRKILDPQHLKGSSSVLLTGNVREVLQSLGMVVDEGNFGDGQLLEAALAQLITIVAHQEHSPGSAAELRHSTATSIYSYLSTCLRRDTESIVDKKIRDTLIGKKVVWVGDRFVAPSNVAFQCQYNCTPYLFELEASIKNSFHKFFEAVGVRQYFEASDVLSILGELKTNNKNNALPEDVIVLISQLAQLLNQITTSEGKNEELDIEKVFLPNKNRVLQPSSCLCIDENPGLNIKGKLNYVHGLISPDIALRLGVKTKKLQHYENISEPISIPFGQHEELTTRIKRLLQGYTFDSSLCKELLQNAEDAGATECKFIMDFRHLGTEKIPEGNYGQLQGPALCFFNNKSFTKADMQGIQNLGVGSKGSDALKIGQFGVGFNSVFHVTDVPSFWTREDDQKEVICVLDPNCSYVPNVDARKPGTKFIDMESVRHSYPDFVKGYLSKAIDMQKPGTLFRFPLRTETMASKSKIKKEVVHQSDIEDLLQDFQKEMNSCLVFLRNLKRIGIYTVQVDGSLKCETEVERKFQNNGEKALQGFGHSLQRAVQGLCHQNGDPLKIPVFDATVQYELTDSSGHSEDSSLHRTSQGWETSPRRR